MIKTTFLLLILATAAMADSPKHSGQCPSCHKAIWGKPSRIETNGISTVNGERIVHRTIHLKHRHLLKTVEFTAQNDLYTGRIKPEGIVEWKLKPPMPK
jgi:hypothetical protein